MVRRGPDETVTRPTGPGAPAPPAEVLSSTPGTAGVSVLVDLPPGWARRVPPTDHERLLILLEGSVRADGLPLTPRSLIEIPAGTAGPPIATEEGARLLVKVGER